MFVLPVPKRPGSDFLCMRPEMCAKQVRQAATAVSDGAVAAVNPAAYIKQLEQ